MHNHLFEQALLCIHLDDVIVHRSKLKQQFYISNDAGVMHVISIRRKNSRRDQETSPR